MMVTATQQVLSADGTESLPILTCFVIENDNLELLNQLRWVKGSKELVLTQESGTVTFDMVSVNTAFPEESHFGTYPCEAISSQDKTEEYPHYRKRYIHTNYHLLIATSYTNLTLTSEFAAQFSVQLQSLNDMVCVRMPELLVCLIAIFTSPVF